MVSSRGLGVLPITLTCVTLTHAQHMPTCSAGKHGSTQTQITHLPPVLPFHLVHLDSCKKLQLQSVTLHSELTAGSKDGAFCVTWFSPSHCWYAVKLSGESLSIPKLNKLCLNMEFNSNICCKTYFNSLNSSGSSIQIYSILWPAPTSMQLRKPSNKMDGAC